MDVADLHSRSVGEFLAQLDRVGGQWSARTPCPEWDVRALVNHVVVEDLWTEPLMGGATMEDVGDRFDGDVLGDDPVATAREAARSAIQSTAKAVKAHRTVHLSYGAASAEEYAYQLAADHLVHGWDLAAATGQNRYLDPELVDAVAVWFEDREELYRGAGAIGERPDESWSGPQDRLLAAFGRRPHWSPTTPKA